MRRAGLRLAAALLPLAVVAAGAGCAVGGAAAAPSDPQVKAQPAPRAGAPAESAPRVISRARVGRPAATTRIRFRPEHLSLPGAGRAEVHPAPTVDGELRVPENVRHLGWWDGGAYAGDPFGSTVIAGHVDSRTEGIGFFARLLRARVGDRVMLTGDGHRATYAITAVKTITKEALADDGSAFDQTAKHRLVLITCTGTYRADRGGYDSNLVIYAKPLGLAR